VIGLHPRLLLVEDDRLERMNLELVLGREGFALDVAACAADAYAFIGRDRYDVIVTDIRLPDESGFEVLRAAKLADPTTKVILVTGSQTQVTPETALLEGAETLMLKPFALADLIATVRRLMPPDENRGHSPFSYKAPQIPL
jgi:DNA-binding response OmpR family regulator